MAVSQACSAVTTWSRSGTSAASIGPSTKRSRSKPSRAARSAPARASSGRASSARSVPFPAGARKSS